MAVKIAIGGPPHSGKTVLVGLLRSLLPRELFMLVEAAPDGEGITGWSFEANPELVKAVRRKGKFLEEFVNWVVASVKTSTAPVTLVDLGGMLLDEAGAFSPTGIRLTPENERILGECSHLIVIANPNYAEAATRWTEEGNRLGVTTLAVLESVLAGADDEVFEAQDGKPFRARITRLEREAPPMNSLAARAVAQRIQSLVQAESHSDGSEGADVNFPQLAIELDLPVKGDGPDRDWVPGELPRFLELVLAKVANQQEICLWGNTPVGFPYHTLACGFSGKVGYYDPKVTSGYVFLPDLEPQVQGNQLLDWRVEEREDHSIVEFSIPRQIFDVENLPLVVPPTVTLDKGVVISGKAPRWLTGALARAYAQAGATWVAVFEPRESGRIVNGRAWSELHPSMGSAVVVYSHDDSARVGDVVPFQLLG